MSRQLISVEEISRSFGAVDVLSDVSFLINEGDRIGIVGHNGAGKTTLLNTISEQKQDMGDIEFYTLVEDSYELAAGNLALGLAAGKIRDDICEQRAKLYRKLRTYPDMILDIDREDRFQII